MQANSLFRRIETIATKGKLVNGLLFTVDEKGAVTAKDTTKKAVKLAFSAPNGKDNPAHVSINGAKPVKLTENMKSLRRELLKAGLKVSASQGVSIKVG